MFGDEVQIIGVAGQGELDEMAEFVDEFDIDGIGHVADDVGFVWRRFQISSQPSYVFINDDGTLWRHSGRLESAPLGEALTRLVEN